LFSKPRHGADVVAILNASLQQAAAMMAFVEAMAGMMFLMVPWVSEYVTPGMSNSLARARAFW